MSSDKHIIDCIWNEHGPPWKCKQCDRVYARKGEPILSDKPPRRNCPKTIQIMVAIFDQLMEEGKDEAADKIGEKIMCYEARRLKGKPCKEKNVKKS